MYINYWYSILFAVTYSWCNITISNIFLRRASLILWYTGNNSYLWLQRRHCFSVFCSIMFELTYNSFLNMISLSITLLFLCSLSDVPLFYHWRNTASEQILTQMVSTWLEISLGWSSSLFNFLLFGSRIIAKSNKKKHVIFKQREYQLDYVNVFSMVNIFFHSEILATPWGFKLHEIFSPCCKSLCTKNSFLMRRAALFRILQWLTNTCSPSHIVHACTC